MIMLSIATLTLKLFHSSKGVSFLEKKMLLGQEILQRPPLELSNSQLSCHIRCRQTTSNLQNILVLSSLLFLSLSH